MYSSFKTETNDGLVGSMHPIKALDLIFSQTRQIGLAGGDTYRWLHIAIMFFNDKRLFLNF
jgi:hypothetical protein